MQKEINAEYPDAEIYILGVNSAGHEENNLMTEGRDLPWLLDTTEADWWGYWDVEWRDVVILDREGEVFGIFNVTLHDLREEIEYQLFKSMLLEAAGMSREN